MIPVSYKYAQLLYEELDNRSKMVRPQDLLEYGYPLIEESPLIKIFVGFVYEPAKALGFSIAQQNRSVALLKAMRCIELLRTGGIGSHSVYLLHYIPTDEKTQEFKERNLGYNTRTIPRKDELYTRDIADLRIRVQKLETLVEELKGRDRHEL